MLRQDEDMPQQNGSRVASIVVASVGTISVLAYALFALLQIMVLNPRAAMPGLGLDRIWADMSGAGELHWPPTTVAIMAIGPISATVILVTAMIRRDTRPLVLAVSYLAILSAGAFAYFAASFGPGMSLADTYYIGGGDV